MQIRTRARKSIVWAVLPWLLLPTPLLASTPCAVSTPTSQGDVAPCDGVLLPDAQVRRCIAAVTVDLPRCYAEIDRARREQDAEIVRLRTVLAAVAAPPPPPMPPPHEDHGLAWAVVGAVVGTALGVTIGAAVWRR